MGEQGIPPWMQEVAKAGGWEKHAEELMKTMDKIPPEKFSNLKEMVINIEKLYDAGGSDLGILSGVKDSIKENIETQFTAMLSPLINEINSTVNTLLAPLMPMIQEGLNTFNNTLSIGTNGIKAMLEGKFDEYIKNLKLEMQDEVTSYVEERTNRMWSSGWGRKLIEKLYGVDLDALEQQAAAGGVYSGQFDIDPDVLEQMLQDLKLPDYTEGT